jgi:ABC-type transporter Mla subunit MlaD
VNDPIIGLALKFVEQGGLYVLLAIYVLQTAITVWGFRALFNALEECTTRTTKIQDGRVEDMRQIVDRAVQAIEVQRSANDATARAAEANARLTQAQGTTIDALKEAISELTRAVFETGRRRS